MAPWSDLIGSGVLPVFVKVKNGNPSQSFLVDPDKCRLVGGGVARERTSAHTQSTGAGGAVETAGAALGSGGMIIAGAIMTTNALSANHQFAVNQLGVHTLSPGAETAGYVYFKIPKPSAALQNCALAIEVGGMGNGKAATFQFPLHIDIH